MKSENKYIGDEKFNKFLDHYACQVPLSVIKMRFIGAACSPNTEIRVADVIASFWEKGKEPRLETKEEADWFFKFFMGLWDEIFNQAIAGKLKLSKVSIKSKEDIIEACHRRYEELESGYVEGFWGGKKNLKIPVYVAELIDSLTELGGVYRTLSLKADRGGELGEIKQAIANSDKMVEKAVSFIFENQVLPKMKDEN